jgi:hypothetical protein
MVPGFSMTSKTRPLVVSKYEMYFRERAPVIKSNRLAEEMFVFIWNGGRAEAQTGYNDDLVMSFAMGLWVRDTALKLRQDGMMRTKLALDYMQKSTAVFNTSNMGNRKFTPIRKLSQDASREFDDHSCDVVFIDMEHSYQAVKNDIISWLPKVKIGGYIAGHDYAPYAEGLIKAVHEHFEKDKIKCIGNCWIVKKEII